MSTPIIGEIIMFGGNFAPMGWAFCDGSLIAIAENDTLFALIGTTYGGDGQTTFALPDLRGRVPVNQGTSTTGQTYVLGQSAGTETVTITTNQLPAHTHPVLSNSADGTTTNPAGNFWASQPSLLQYAPAATINSNLKATAVTSIGGNQPHDNMIPFQAINYVISLFGVFPSRN